jgi:predicted XRE-type DNA-binding protein
MRHTVFRDRSSGGWKTSKMKAKVKEPQKNRKSGATGKKAELSSGNIFADLGFQDAEQRLLKAKLATRIAQLVEKKGLTQAQTAERTALDQPKVSRLLRGQLSGFSADRLFTVLNRLGHSVEVRISAKERPPEKSHTRVMIG